jgi:hypothetical protein
MIMIIINRIRLLINNPLIQQPNRMLKLYIYIYISEPHTGILFRGRVQQIQLRTADRQNGDLGAVAP